MGNTTSSSDINEQQTNDNLLLPPDDNNDIDDTEITLNNHHITQTLSCDDSRYVGLNAETSCRALIEQFDDILMGSFASSDEVNVLSIQTFIDAAPLPDHMPSLQHFMHYCVCASQHSRIISHSRFRLVPRRLTEDDFWKGYLSRLLDYAGHLESDAHEMFFALPTEQVLDQPHNDFNDDIKDSLYSDDSIIEVKETHYDTKHIKNKKMKTNKSKKKKKHSNTSEPNKNIESEKHTQQQGENSNDNTPQIQVLIGIRECFVYRVPPRAHSAGYYAQRWTLEQPMWSGRFQLVARYNDDSMTVRLLEADGVSLFAESMRIDVRSLLLAPLHERGSVNNFIEKVLDSSRYFVIRFTDATSGNSAMLGVGFRERSSAFDMNAAIADHMRRARQRLVCIDDELTSSLHSLDINDMQHHHHHTSSSSSSSSSSSIVKDSGEFAPMALVHIDDDECVEVPRLSPPPSIS